MRRLRHAIALFVWPFVCVCAAPLATGRSVQAVAQAPPPATRAEAQTRSQYRMLVQQYCVPCHNERRRTADLTLDTLDLQNVASQSAVLEKVVQKLRSGTMPPPGLPRPDPGTAAAFAGSLEWALDAAAAAHPNPGHVAVHRLNRAEYVNAIRDLLALELDDRSLLPADDVSKGGFSNAAAVLSVSPALVDRYVAAARKISRLAIGDPAIVPGFDVYEVPKLLVQDDRLSEDLPFGTRGGVAVRHHFPLDADYVVKIRLRRQLYSYILGMGHPHQLDVRIDGRRIKVFTVGGENKGRAAPATYSGNVPGDPEWETYMHFADDGLEVRVRVHAGTRTVGVAFVENTPEPEGVVQPPQTGFNKTINEDYDGNPAVEQVSIGGPYNPDGPGETPSRRKIFLCRPGRTEDEPSCAQKILSGLVRRAYRRPPKDVDVQGLMTFYQDGRSQGSFDVGIESALQRILIDPEFLFRLERNPAGAEPGTVYRLGDVELASRLSFFLWSSIPDDELLDLAAAGGLKGPAALERQVRRMLADRRSAALVDNFAFEWLGLTKLRGVSLDPEIFPEFDENLRESLGQETKAFIESQLREDASVVTLLTANYSFLNERLARHYGIPNVYGNRLRKVTFEDGRRGGLLAQGSILTVTSYANRTSPVLRGKWLLETILGTPPPPPPPDVPALKEAAENGAPSSLRQRMESHRSNPACASCHVRMDPLGFALEHFDSMGRWRETSDGTPIDAAGAFPDGTRFDGLSGVRALLGGRRDEFGRALIEKLLAYAVGRDLDVSDRPAIRAVARDAAAADYRWSAIISGIVASTPFQMSVVTAGDAEGGRSGK